MINSELHAGQPDEPLGPEEAWLATPSGNVRIWNPPDGPCTGEPDSAHRPRVRAQKPQPADDVLAEIRSLRASFDALRRALPPLFGTMDQAARATGMSLSTIRRRVKDGAIPTKKIGRRRLVDLAALRPLDEEEIATLARKVREE